MLFLCSQILPYFVIDMMNDFSFFTDSTIFRNGRDRVSWTSGCVRSVSLQWRPQVSLSYCRESLVQTEQQQGRSTISNVLHESQSDFSL